MIEDFLKKIMEEPTEEENQVSDVLREICVRDHFSSMDTMFALRYFNGIEPTLIINKINVAVTPLIYPAMKQIH